MKRFIIAICLLVSGVAGSAETVKGVVKDTAGKPMPYATVLVEALKQSAICDASGRYELSAIPKGRHTLKASFIGYQTVEQSVEVESDVTADFTMEEVSVTLTEYIVLPKGMDISTYVLTQLDKNRKPLKKRLTSYSCRNTALMEKSIDLSTLKKRKTIRFGLALMGWGKSFDIMVKYKNLRVQMTEDVQFNKGKITNTQLKILSMNPRMTDDEVKAFCKKDWFLNDNSYDRFYDEMHKKIKDLKSKNSKYKLEFCGSYDEGNRTIYIMRYGHTQVEVASDCWQIRRMRYQSNSRSVYFEFSELAPGVFLPVSGHAEYNIDYEGYPKGVVKISTAYKYFSVKK